MFGLPIGLLIRVGAALALAAALAWGYHLMAEHFREQGRAELRPEIATLQASIAATQARATSLALLWAAQVDKTEDKARKTEVDRAQTFATLLAEAKRVAGPRLSATDVELLNRARRSANGETTGPTPVPDEAAATGQYAVSVAAAAANTRSTNEFIVALYAWIGECKDRVDEWHIFYFGLQQATK